MYWQEENQDEAYVVPNDVVDLAFKINCRSLPVDHAYALSQALCNALPWFKDQPDAGMHTIHVAESGNGWMRPDHADALLHPSRRTRFVIRVPSSRIDDATQLVGQMLNVDGHAVQIGEVSVRHLSDHTTVFSRHVVSEPDWDESQFLDAMFEQLTQMGIQPKKMLCGIEKTIKTPDTELKTRSLMMADLTVAEAIKVQQKGLGPHRHLGCGIFILHKDIQEVNS
jgi:CRISPR-associated protein Cas6